MASRASLLTLPLLVSTIALGCESKQGAQTEPAPAPELAPDADAATAAAAPAGAAEDIKAATGATGSDVPTEAGALPPTGMAAAPTSNGLTTGPASSAVVDKARTIQGHLACMRGKPFKKDPEVAFQSLEDFRKYVDKQLVKELGGEKGARLVRTLHALDIVDPSVDVMKQLVDAAVGQAAAYYDPETNAFYVVQNMPDLMLNMVMAHELQHALQDQHTSLLDDYLDDGFGSTDKDLATRFIVEGEATLIGNSWMAHNIERKLNTGNDICYLPDQRKGDPGSFWPTMSSAMSQAAAQTRDDIVNPGMLERVAMSGMSEGMADSMKQLKELPVYFFYTLLLPYNQGGQTVYTHFTANGFDWQSIDELFANPPDTTEQVLHPSKLQGEREGFRELKLAEVPPLAEAAREGWQVDPSDRMGELSVRIWLIEEGIDERTASQAAAGWDGDQIAVWHKGEDLLAFDWKLAWDRSEDRQEFMNELPAAIAKQRGIQDTSILATLAQAKPGDEGMVGFNWTDTQGRTRHGRISWTADLIHWTDGWDQPVEGP